MESICPVLNEHYTIVLLTKCIGLARPTQIGVYDKWLAFKVSENILARWTWADRAQDFVHHK